jgi:hypothetical protein
VLLRIQGLGSKIRLFGPFFTGERKSGSSRQIFESLLPVKKHPKLPGILLIWATFSTKNFFAVFSAFLRVSPFGLNRNFWFFCGIWGLDPKDPDRIQILFKNPPSRKGQIRQKSARNWDDFRPFFTLRVVFVAFLVRILPYLRSGQGEIYIFFENILQNIYLF